MIGWERRVLLRHDLDQGLTVTEISRELGISRQTVCRSIKSGEPDREVEEVRYGPRPPVLTKLDPYKDMCPVTLTLTTLADAYFYDPFVQSVVDLPPGSGLRGLGFRV